MEFFDDSNIETNTTKSADIDTQVQLVTNFFNHFNDIEEDFFRSMLVDLYRAITCYRMYNSIEEFMRINPELDDCRADIKELWAEFDKLSSEELAEVALELLKDI